MKPAIAALAFAAGLELAAAAQAQTQAQTPFDTKSAVDLSQQAIALDPALMSKVDDLRRILTEMNERQKTVVVKQHADIVKELGARIDALTEEVSTLRAVLGTDTHGKFTPRR